MKVTTNKNLINVLNAAVTSNHQQVKTQLHDLIAKVHLMPLNDNPLAEDWVTDVVNQIYDIQHKLDDVTDYIRIIKVAEEDESTV